MERDRDPFGQALSRLREDLRDGRLRPGEPLITSQLASSLKISATPIREAVSRLAGEGLLEDHRGRGVYVPRYAAEDVEALYRLHGAYVALAINARLNRRRGEEDGVAPGLGGTPRAFRDRTEQLWSGLIQRGGGQVIVRGHKRIVDQLAVMRLVEPQVLGAVWSEMSALISTIATSNLKSLLEAVDQYHERRQDHSRSIAAALLEWMAPPAL